MQVLIHYTLHLLLPFAIAYIWYRKRFFQATAVLLLTMLIDLDHLFAIPVFDACRCSIGFHPLHSGIALAVYVAFLFFKKTRLLAIGLLLHMLTDLIDCAFIWQQCL